jgi:alcohol dehydrogenase (cytochrome c)
VPVLADLPVAGQVRKVVMQANRNGFFYVLDRANGKFIYARPYVYTDWAKEVGGDGRPVLVPGHDPTEAGTSTCPDWYGGTNFMSPSFDKTTNMFYLTVRETCARFIRRAAPDDVKVGDRTMGGQVAPLPDRRWGAVRAIDATTGDQKWDVKYGSGWAGSLPHQEASCSARIPGISDDRCKEWKGALHLSDWHDMRHQRPPRGWPTVA